MSEVHVFRASEQPATKYVCDAGFTIGLKPRVLLRSHCCSKRRWAINLWVQSYYDGDRFFCKKGKGCKEKQND